VRRVRTWLLVGRRTGAEEVSRGRAASAGAHSTAQHYTAQHGREQVRLHSTALHSTALHSTARAGAGPTTNSPPPERHQPKSLTLTGSP
jgi:hypothetical protein